MTFTADSIAASLADQTAAPSLNAQVKAENAEAAVLAEQLRPLTWSSFAQSLVEQFDRKGFLSAKQISAGQNVVAGAARKAAEGGSAPNAAEVQAAKASGADVEPVYDGIGTIELPGGGYRTFRLRTQKADAKFAPGEQVISFLNGPDNENDYQGFGFIKGDQADPKLIVWKAHRGSQVETDARYLIANLDQAKFEVHCFACRKLLTVPASQHRGYGPDCFEKLG